MNRVTVNGTTIVTSGRSISVVGNKVIIDGKEIDLPDAKQINVSVEGPVEKLEVDVCEKISITGNVGGNISTMSGDVRNRK